MKRIGVQSMARADIRRGPQRVESVRWLDIGLRLMVTQKASRRGLSDPISERCSLDNNHQRDCWHSGADGGYRRTFPSAQRFGSFKQNAERSPRARVLDAYPDLFTAMADGLVAIHASDRQKSAGETRTATHDMGWGVAPIGFGDSRDQQHSRLRRSIQSNLSGQRRRASRPSMGRSQNCGARL